MIKRLFAVAILLALASPGAVASEPSDDNSEVNWRKLPLMIVPGYAEVSAKGQVVFRIPLIYPQPSAEVGPQLAIEYASDRGDSSLGIGWGVTGTSAITRCMTPPGPNNLSTSRLPADAYCLDGKPLVAVHGKYGQDGTEYRTVIDEFSRIVSRQKIGDDPMWFEMHTRGGNIMSFGGVASSRFSEPGSSRLQTWEMDRAGDVMNSYVAISYAQDVSSGQIYPVRFDYTGNDRTGLVPYNSIRLQYEPRAPAAKKGPPLLVAITSYTEQSLVQQYRLSYEKQIAGLAPHLSGIAQCDATNKCLAPTTVKWGSGDRSDLTTAIENGVGGTTELLFEPLPGHPVFVCSGLQGLGSDGHIHSELYSYQDPAFDPATGELLGFKHITKINDLAREVDDYLLDFPFQGLVQAKTSFDGKRLIYSLVNSYTNASRALPAVILLSKKTETKRPLFVKVTTTYSYNDYAEITESTETAGDDVAHYRYSYADDVDRWYLDRIAEISTSWTDGSRTNYKTASFAYDALWGILTQEVIEPHIAYLRSSIDYRLNEYGLRISRLASDKRENPGQTDMTYDPRSRFMIARLGPGHNNETWTFDGRFEGNVRTSHTDASGFVAKWDHDGFGNVTSEIDSDGTTVRTSYKYCAGINGGSAPCPKGAAFVVETQRSTRKDGTTPPTFQYYGPGSDTFYVETTGNHETGF